MIKNVTLKENRIARIDDLEPFYLPSEEGLVFCFDQGNFNLSNAFIQLKNGTHKEMFPYKKTFEVPTEFLEEGFLKLDIFTMKKNDLVNAWTLLPVRIKYVEEFENTYSEKLVYDYLADLERRVKALEDKEPNDLF